VSLDAVAVSLRPYQLEVLDAIDEAEARGVRSQLATAEDHLLHTRLALARAGRMALSATVHAVIAQLEAAKVSS